MRQAATSIDHLRLPEIDFSFLRKRVLLSSATRTTGSDESGWIRYNQPDTAESAAERPILSGPARRNRRPAITVSGQTPDAHQNRQRRRQ